MLIDKKNKFYGIQKCVMLVSRKLIAHLHNMLFLFTDISQIPQRKLNVQLSVNMNIFTDLISDNYKY